MSPTSDPTLARRALELVAELVGADPATTELRVTALDREQPALAAEVRSLLAAVADSNGFLAEPLAPPLPAEAELPARVGPFEVVGPIARGGTGVVVHARRTEPFRQEVAIKLMRRGLPASERARFEDERRHLAQIEHPNVARIIDGGELADGVPYLAEELVRGLPIDDYCTTRSLSLDDRLALFLDVLDGVAAVHAAGIVHGDLKPDNLLVDDGGRPRIVDFGISQLAGAGAPLERYTPGFASPELVAGAPPTPASDVFALGRTLARLVAGAPAPRGLPRGLAALRRRDLACVIAHATAADAAARYRTVAELRAAVVALRAQRPIAAPGAAASRFVLRTPRRTSTFAAAALAALFALGALGKAAFDAWNARIERGRIEQAERLCGELLAAVSATARLPVERALDATEVVRRLDALDRLGTSASDSPALGYARGCAAFARLDLRRASAELQPLASGAEATPRARRLHAHALSGASRLDFESLSRLFTGTERSRGASDGAQRVSNAELAAALEANQRAESGADPLDLARTALAQNRSLEALRLARQRATAAPDDVVARQLEAEAALTLARVSGDTGPNVPADWNDAARAAIEAGLAIAPADPWLHLLECRRREHRLDLLVNQQRPIAELAQFSSVPCTTALRLAPALTDGRLASAWLRFQTVRALANAGNDPTAELAHLAADADAARAAHPADSSIPLVRGLATNAAIHWAISTARDPAELAAAAERELESAERLTGPTTRTLRARAAVSLQLASWQATTGADPGARFGAARELYAAALERSPSDLVSLSGLGSMELRRAEHQLATGRDPRPAAAEAIAVSERALAIAPGNLQSRFRRVEARRLVLEHLVAAGEPSAELETLLSDELDELATLDPMPRTLVWLRLGVAHAQALAALRSSGRPGPIVAAAVAEAERALGRTAPDFDERLRLARLHLVAAQGADATGAEAARALAVLEPIDPASPDPGEVERLRERARSVRLRAANR